MSDTIARAKLLAQESHSHYLTRYVLLGTEARRHLPQPQPARMRGSREPAAEPWASPDSLGGYIPPEAIAQHLLAVYALVGGDAARLCDTLIFDVSSALGRDMAYQCLFCIAAGAKVHFPSWEEG